MKCVCQIQFVWNLGVQAGQQEHLNSTHLGIDSLNQGLYTENFHLKNTPLEGSSGISSSAKELNMSQCSLFSAVIIYPYCDIYPYLP